MSLLAVISLGMAVAPAQVPNTQAVSPSGITRQEAVRRADRLFDLLDVNHDGILTKGEARAEGMTLVAERAATGKDMAPGIGGRTLSYFKRALAADVTITREEFEQIMLAHFDEMDTDHDGILTAQERQEGRRGVEKGR